MKKIYMILLGVGGITLAVGVGAYALKKKKQPSYSLWKNLKEGDMISGDILRYKGKSFFKKI